MRAPISKVWLSPLSYLPLVLYVCLLTLNVQTGLCFNPFLLRGNLQKKWIYRKYCDLTFLEFPMLIRLFKRHYWVCHKKVHSFPPRLSHFWSFNTGKATEDIPWHFTLFWDVNQIRVKQKSNEHLNSVDTFPNLYVFPDLLHIM